jgi:hypothetical protein
VRLTVIVANLHIAPLTGCDRDARTPPSINMQLLAESKREGSVACRKRASFYTFNSFGVATDGF